MTNLICDYLTNNTENLFYKIALEESDEIKYETKMVLNEPCYSHEVLEIFTDWLKGRQGLQKSSTIKKVKMVLPQYDLILEPEDAANAIDEYLLQHYNKETLEYYDLVISCYAWLYKNNKTYLRTDILTPATLEGRDLPYSIKDHIKFLLEEKIPKQKEVKKVYYNMKKGITIVEFYNGEKVRVTREKGDAHDLEKAIAIAMVKYAFGLDTYLKACEKAINSEKNKEKTQKKQGEKKTPREKRGYDKVLKEIEERKAKKEHNDELENFLNKRDKQEE